MKVGERLGYSVAPTRRPPTEKWTSVVKEAGIKPE
jgi:hypothetical protein